MTVSVDDVRGVAGFVLPGDFVDIVIIADDGSPKRQSYSDILLEHVERRNRAKSQAKGKDSQLSPRQ